MLKSKNRFGGIAGYVCLLGFASGCAAPAEPVTTMWQAMGIPQATLAMRDGLTNRRGNFPGLERRPPLLRIADPANLDSEIPAIKAAAKVKEAEDLAPQKIKALKYLASVGCGCYDKDGEIEAALLDALQDCTEDVRIEAANTIAEAAGTCACRYDGCAPTCCKPSITKRLYDMAYEVDDSGCPIEPSREVREAAARAVEACASVPQPVEEDEEPIVEPDPNGEDLPPGEPDRPTEDLPPQAGRFGDGVPFGQSMPVHEFSDGRSDGLVAPMSHEIEIPENMVIGSVTGQPALDRLIIRLGQAYQIEAGWDLLLVTPDGDSATCRVLLAEGSRIEVISPDFIRKRFDRQKSIFVGLISD